MLKRTLVVMAVAVGLAGLSATAALGHPAEGPTPEVTDVEWTLTRAECKSLPKHLKLTGEGTSRKYTTIGSDGSYTEMTFVNGTAKDNRGGRYRFDYSNTLTTQSTILPWAGIISDYFSLDGRGAADGLHTAFLANFNFTSEDPLIFTFEPIYQIGDPISFPDGEEHCDPI